MVDLNKYLRPVRYLASAFVNAQGLTANTQNVGKLLGALGQHLDDEQMLPTTIQEPTPSGPRPRIGFVSPEGTKFLTLLTTRFDYTEQSQLDLAEDAPSEEAKALGDFEVFCDQAARFLRVTLEHTDLKAHRLACVRESILVNFEHLDVLRRMLTLPGPYRQTSPLEWNWRVNSHIEREFGEWRELTNTITTIAHAQSQLIIMDHGAIRQSSMAQTRMDFDINTVIDNTEPRFDGAHLPEFFRAAVNWHAQLSQDMLQYVASGGE
jgi:hypothetical protein